MPIYDVNKLLDSNIPEGYYDTLSGYILEELGRIPKTKEKVKIENDDVIFTVEKVEDRRISLVKAEKKEKVVMQDDEEQEEKDEKEDK